MTLTYILLFTFLGSIGSVLIASLFLLCKHKTQKKLIPILVTFATGALLGSAFLGLIPESLEHLSAKNVFTTVLGGILFFFFLEKLIRVHHCHNVDCHSHDKSLGKMIFVGDALHNFIDGLMIAGAFLVSIPAGIMVALAVIIHEIPQELGDFGIFLHSGYSKKKALVMNTISSATAFVGAGVGYIAFQQVHEFVPYVMALAAASFIYIALVDLSPELHKQTKLSHSFQQIFLLILGVGVIALVSQFHGH
jgi:zinc and cadmium transporter